MSAIACLSERITAVFCHFLVKHVYAFEAAVLGCQTGLNYALETEEVQGEQDP
jgi:hypothetical protein